MKINIILSFCVFLFATIGGYANTYYVEKSGNDANPGSQSQPWLSIQKAANTAIAGDTVLIKAGTYNERVIVQNSGTANDYIVFSNYGNENTNIPIYVDCLLLLFNL